jgi:glycosyltransferase involved in cell wall biosynthesis
MYVLRDLLAKSKPPSPEKRAMPRVVMTLMVRDEADIIRPWLDYHLGIGVDLIVALDNDSVDETTPILKEYERAGRLVYFHEPSHDYLQDAWVTDLARRAARDYQADWVINSDADEFFIPEKGLIKDILARVPADVTALSIKRHDMVPIARPGTLPAPLKMIYRKNPSLEWVTGHPLADKVIHRGSEDVEVGRGSHAVSSEQPGRSVPSRDIVTLHFPIRSAAQFANKVRHVGSGRKKNGLTGSRYAYWYDCLLDGRLEQVYQGYQCDERQIREKLASGELIEDRRLADILAKRGWLRGL